MSKKYSNDEILNALNSIDPATLTYSEWINVGMALKEEGFDCEVWDSWSSTESRYHKGDCAKHWRTFNGTSNPVTVGTLIEMAKNSGFSRYSDDIDMFIDWEDAIEFDGYDYDFGKEWNPVQDLITYIETLFEPTDYVSYVTKAQENEDGKFTPANKGSYDRTAQELVDSLRSHPTDIGATIGDWEEKAGAWIRFNPVDGQGVNNRNVTRFKYALVESDTMTVADQEAMWLKLQLPIAAMVNSGGKSMHAIVKIDAADEQEYRKRVEFLYDYIKKQDRTIQIDSQNRNPSRLSRMPGVTRNGKRQKLVATNIGRNSWNEWMDFVEGVEDELPDFEPLSLTINNPPKLNDVLIEGILREGHKMLISGSSKGGKSFLLMELCIAISEGRKWLGLQCKKGKVLYVNLEIDRASCINRFYNIYKAIGFSPQNADNIVIWNLRGKAMPMSKLVPKLIRRIKDCGFSSVVIDPIYKIFEGSESDQEAVGRLCNQFDKVCTETGCAMIYCHHHSKGAQGNKNAIDRMSGSGVFARDPDAQLDMIELDLTEEMRRIAGPTKTAWQLESSLREFANIKPIKFWFDYPLHTVDSVGELKEVYAKGSEQSKKTKKKKDDSFEIRHAFEICASLDNSTSVEDMAAYLGYTEEETLKKIKATKDFYIRGNEVMYKEG